jgi:hypothetical protein
MNGVEILSSEIIYNTILPEWCFYRRDNTYVYIFH